MRSPILVFSFLLCCLRLAAQHENPAAAGASSSTAGVLFGKVTDSAGKAVGNASVVILKLTFDAASQSNKSKLIKGVITKENGEFNLEDIPFSEPFQLKISAAGYKDNTRYVSLKRGDVLKDLGKIKIDADFRRLQDVTVNSSVQLMKMDIDKISYNVEKNMVTAGGTAIDVIRYIPAVQTDIDGNVKLRNAAPQIYVDGRPTMLSLEQIPADVIESIEVITNPSAKYDASGGNAGILNIVLKKGRKTGYNVNLRGGVDRRGTLNGGGDLNMRQGNFNISAAFNGMQFRNFSTGVTNQFNAFLSPHQQISQDNDNKSYGGVIFQKFGLDYFASNRTTLSANLIRVSWKFEPEDVTMANVVAGGVQRYANRYSQSKRAFSPTGYQFGMKHIFPKAGREITADATYFSGNTILNSFFSTDSLDAARTKYANEQQLVVATGFFKLLTVQTDYTTPIGANSKFETGIRASFRELGNSNETSINNGSGFKSVLNAGSNYANKDNVFATYAIFSSTGKTIGYQLGLRAESSYYTGTVLSTGSVFKNNYPLSLFPSVYLSKKLGASQQLQLNFTRRVNRPSFFTLVPYIDRTDPLNYSRGNPDIKPEFTNSFNMSYNRILANRNNLLISAYYKLTTDLITRFQQKEMDPVTGKDILVNSYINSREASSYGFEVTSIIAVKKWWDLTANINAYNSKINTSNITAESPKALWSWFGKMNSSFKLPASYTIQLTADYQSRSNLPIGTTSDGGHMAQAQMASQGYIDAFYGVDISVKKSFLKDNAASVTMVFSDIFRSRWQNQHSENAYFTQDYTRIKDPQMLRLSFSYRFGKADMSLFKRKNMKTEGEMQGAMGAN